MTFGPDGMTGHPDHRAISTWTTAAWRASGSTARLLYATTTEAFVDEHRHLHELLPVFGPGLPLRAPDEDVALSVHVDGRFLDAKERALHSHATQVGVLIEAFGVQAFRTWWRTETFTAARRD